MDKKVLKRIKESKRKYDRHSQRLELLKRNENFLKEFRGIYKRLSKKFFQFPNMELNKVKKLSEDNILLKLDYPKVNIKTSIAYYAYIAERDEPDDPASRIKKDVYFNAPDLNTIIFDEDYPGDLEVALNDIRNKTIWKFRVLERYMEKWTEFCNRWYVDASWDGKLSTLSNFPGSMIDFDIYYRGRAAINSELFPILIQIGPYTTLRDIGKRWSEIKEYQKKVIAQTPQQSETFGRDLCWYDLKKTYGLSYNAIAKAWREACEDDKDLLKMVDSLVSFQDCNFRDLIKKSIRNMEKKISRLYKAPLFKSVC